MKNIIEYVKNEGLKFESYTNWMGNKPLQVIIGDEKIIVTDISNWLVVSAGGYDYFKYEELDVIYHLENQILLLLIKSNT